MALCSRMKSECRMARPTQKLPADARQVDELLQVLGRQAQVVDPELALLVRRAAPSAKSGLLP